MTILGDKVTKCHPCRTAVVEPSPVVGNSYVAEAEALGPPIDYIALLTGYDPH